jgi:plastocyanin
MPRLAFVAALAGLLLCGGAPAATVTATVVDKSGRPLPGAVVMLEPVGIRLAVKPMSGVEIAQAKRTFIPDVTVVTVGTPVTFPNRDTVRHHVYSFSSAKTFELKLYSGTPSMPVVFDRPGVVVLGCNIHDLMSAWVVVVDTPYHGRSGEQGQARLDAVAAGAYRLVAWHPRLAPDAALPSVGVNVGGSDVEASVRVEAPSAAAP